MAAKNAIVTEILAATKQKPQAKKETDQEFYLRLMNAVAGLDEETDYAGLSEATKEWYGEAVEAVNAVEGEGAPDLPAPTDKKEKVEDKEEANPKAAKGKKAAAEKAPAKKELPKKVAKPKKEKVERVPTKEPRQASASDMVKYLLCKSPKATKEQIAAALKEKKIICKPELLAVEHMRTTRVLHFLRELGKISF